MCGILGITGLTGLTGLTGATGATGATGTFTSAYADMYRLNTTNPASGQFTVASVGTTYLQFTPTSVLSQGILNNITFADNQFTIISSGDYMISYNISFVVGNSNSAVLYAIFKNNSIVNKSISYTTSRSTSQPIMINYGYMDSLVENDVLEIRFRKEVTPSANFTFFYVNVNIFKLS